MDKAKTILLQDLRDFPLDEGDWNQILNHPWLEELRDDPRVAARFAETAAARQEMIEDVRQLLLHPEWQLN